MTWRPGAPASFVTRGRGATRAFAYGSAVRPLYASETPPSPSIVTDPAEARITVEWSLDYRSCAVRVVAFGGEALLLRFRSPEPVLDPIARVRMEQAAYDAASRLVDL